VDESRFFGQENIFKILLNALWKKNSGIEDKDMKGEISNSQRSRPGIKFPYNSVFSLLSHIDRPGGENNG
jgi:hypothetical protein